jgi:hypothetical protein
MEWEKDVGEGEWSLRWAASIFSTRPSPWGDEDEGGKKEEGGKEEEEAISSNWLGLWLCCTTVRGEAWLCMERWEGADGIMNGGVVVVVVEGVKLLLLLLLMFATSASSAWSSALSLSLRPLINPPAALSCRTKSIGE